MKPRIIVPILLALAPACSIHQICFPDFQDCPGEETGSEVVEGQAWCMENPQTPDEPIRSFCYPIDQPQPEFYIETECAAFFDFPAWNYDGTCAPGVCASEPRINRLCFDEGQAGAVAMKALSDKSVRMCWEDAIANGDTAPSLYLTMDYTDDQMRDPLCIAQEDVSELGPTCRHDRGAVCLSHNLFCSCHCDSDADCDAPMVCEGAPPDGQGPWTCVVSFG